MGTRLFSQQVVDTDLFAILRRLDVEVKVMMVCLLLLLLLLMSSLSWISFGIEEILVSDC